ncbi:MAG: cupredoxin domain-containing protein [Vicinamibacterales bacterium]
MDHPKVIIRSGLLALLLSSIGCDYGSPTAPESSTPGPEGASISITSSGLTPNTVSIAAGQSVTFRNDDAIAHEIVSAPVPTYSDCPPVNRVGRLEPGQTMQTGALTGVRSCGFLDLLRTGDGRWQGAIVIQ